MDNIDQATSDKLRAILIQIPAGGETYLHKRNIVCISFAGSADKFKRSEVPAYNHWLLLLTNDLMLYTKFLGLSLYVMIVSNFNNQPQPITFLSLPSLGWNWCITLLPFIFWLDMSNFAVLLSPLIGCVHC